LIQELRTTKGDLGGTLNLNYNFTTLTTHESGVFCVHLAIVN